MANEHDIWQWQEPGTAWKGAGIYHVTLTIPSMEPLLGKLVIPENDPKKAYIQRTKLGNALVEKLQKTHKLVTNHLKVLIQMIIVLLK
jgi:oligoribonuclease NrnB/cAMP/cGMP phosphodiesterase (DHH superfamily)